jgi:hypothetical protein
MFIVKRVRFDALLPATPCSAEMREKMQQLAQREGASLAELQRSAFSLFLSESDKLVSGEEKPVSEVQS